MVFAIIFVSEKKKSRKNLPPAKKSSEKSKFHPCRVEICLCSTIAFAYSSVTKYPADIRRPSHSSAI